MQKLLTLALLLAVFSPLARAVDYDLGTHGMLSLNHPPSWAATIRDTREGGRAITIQPKDGNAKCSIILEFFKQPRPIEQAKIRDELTRAAQKLVAGSVEGKMIVHEMELPQGYGAYCPFRDAATVGKPSVKGNFKTISFGKMQLTDTIGGTVSILADELDGDDAIVMWHMVRSMRVKAGK